MPRVGLLSDSHGRADTTRQAVRVLREAGAEILIHLGDLGSEAVIDALADAVPVYLVFGNTDIDIAAMARYATGLGITVSHPTGRIQLSNGVLVYQHGDWAASMQAAITERVTYLCHGHTHLQRDERIGGTRVINPGALFRASAYTVALLDTDRDSVSFHPVVAKA